MEKKYVFVSLILGIFVLSIVGSFIVTKLTGYFASPCSKPTIISGKVYPEKVSPGQFLTVTVEVEDKCRIEEVTGKIYHEKGWDDVILERKYIKSKKSIYEIDWKSHDGVNMEWYDIIVQVKNKDKKSEIKLKYQDPTVNHSASEVTAGTFDSGNFVFQGNLTVDSPDFHVDATNGRVGIGTITPSNNLDVVGTTISRISVNSTGANSYAGIELVNDARGWLIQTQSDLADSLIIYDETSTKIRMTIDSTDGNVGIGTITPGSRLEVENISVANDVLLLQDNSGTCEAQPATDGLTWSCSSDISLKENITEPTSYLDYVVGIPLFDYTVKKTGERVTGWIAQEMLKHPEYENLVTNNTYQDTIGYDEVFNNETNQIDKIPILETKSELAVSEISQPILIKSIQELSQKNDELESRIDSLETRITELEKLLGG